MVAMVTWCVTMVTITHPITTDYVHCTGQIKAGVTVRDYHGTACYAKEVNVKAFRSFC